MECKWHIPFSQAVQYPELIDTLWNVNEITYDQLARTPDEN